MIAPAPPGWTGALLVARRRVVPDRIRSFSAGAPEPLRSDRQVGRSGRCGAEQCVVAPCQGLPFEAWFLSSDQIEDARGAASELLFRDTRKRVPTDATLRLHRLLHDVEDAWQSSKARHHPVEAHHGRIELAGEPFCERGLAGTGPPTHDDKPATGSISHVTSLAQHRPTKCGRRVGGGEESAVGDFSTWSSSQVRFAAETRNSLTASPSTQLHSQGASDVDPVPADPA